MFRVDEVSGVCADKRAVSQRTAQFHRATEDTHRSGGAAARIKTDSSSFELALIDGRVTYGLKQRQSFDRNGFILLPRFLSQQGLLTLCNLSKKMHLVNDSQDGCV